MNISSIAIITMIIVAIPFALYIDSIRRNRDSKGRFLARKPVIKNTIRLIPIYQFGRIIGHITL